MVNLASSYARKGLSVALCDHDPQRSSLDWLRARPAHLLPIEGFEFFDHQLLIPALPTATDIRACVRHLVVLNRAGVVEQNPGKFGLIANRVNLKTNYFKVLLTFLNEVNLPIIEWLAQSEAKTLGPVQSTIDELLGS
ncbi:MAG: chromosome partitioning protein [Candidatus Azotimanducaceae bacterium]